MIKSKLLQDWVEELTAERKKFYRNKKDIYEELTGIRNWVNEETRKAISKSREALVKNIEDYVPAEETYMLAWQNLEAIGIHYEKEHFVETRNNGTTYSIIYMGQTVSSKMVFKTEQGVIRRTYNIMSSYFLMNESKTLLEIIESKDNLDELAEVEIKRYVESLLSRIESKYGKVISVKDSMISNVARVYFECEKGKCYLERILAGGYNIQVLHNRILLKPLK